MNQTSTAAPLSFAPASCPLLAAVLPVRYAIGPLRAPASATLSAAKLQLPAISGAFPELGPDHPQLGEYGLGYVPRMLRDGWLYVWQESLGQLVEYQVERSLLNPTAREGAALDGEARAYLIMPAGVPAQLAWSPVRWSDARFASLRDEPSLRQTAMREIVPGAGPFSGPVASALSELGDHHPQDYRWSCAPNPQAGPLQASALRRMKRCEQQFHAVVDDPWGILMDLAWLLCARKEAFERFARVRADEWAIASTVKTVSENDARIRGQLDSLIDVTRLERTLREQAHAMDEHDADVRRIVGFWTDWLATFGEAGPGTLESACENFDITQPDTRDLLEASFAAALMGPATTSLGVKAIERILELQSGAGEPWLLWALLGVTKRMGPGELKQLLDMPENLAAVSEEATNLTQVAVLVTAINLGADKVANLQPRSGGEPLFAVLSPILAGRFRSFPQQIHSLAYTLVIAMLARSQQRLETESLPIEQALRWLGEQTEKVHDKGQRQNLRAQQVQPPPSLTAVSKQISESIPHLRVVPHPQPVPAYSQPGYGSTVPHAAVNKPATALPPLAKVGSTIQIPSISELLNEAPLKTLIALVALWNVYRTFEVWNQNFNVQTGIALFGASFSVATAGTTILQKLAETNWKNHVSRSGHINSKSQEFLARALVVGSASMLLQAITAGIDVFHYGWQALDAYRAGDLDNSAVNVGLATANLAYARVSLQAMRAMRIARAAVIAGETGALTTGITVLSLPLRLTLLGLAVTILAGMLLSPQTKDSPLETWFKNTRFGTHPAEWSNSFAPTLQALYQAIFPVRASLERWTDINPRIGLINELRLVIRLPGQTEYRPDMLRLEGYEEWETERGLLDFGAPLIRRVPFAPGENQPLTLDIGNRVTPEADGSIRLRRAYHEPEGQTLVRIRGTLIYHPVQGIELPPIDIDVS